MHTGKQDHLSIGNHHSDRLTVAGAEQKGFVASRSALSTAGSERNMEAQTQAWEFDL